VIENLQSNSNFKFLHLVFSFWRNLAGKKKVMNPNVISCLPYISRVEVVGLSSSFPKWNFLNLRARFVASYDARKLTEILIFLSLHVLHLIV
jgi:hypothetical protein